MFEKLKAAWAEYKFLKGTGTESQQDVPPEIACEEVKRLLDSGKDFLLVDVRTNDEWEDVHIDGARHFPRNRIYREMNNLGKSKRIVIYCQNGIASFRAMCLLRHSGFNKAQSMRGGIKQYTSRIDPDMKR